MPFSVSTSDNTTELVFTERCSTEDAIEIKDELTMCINEAPCLRFDTTKAEGIDTASLQLALSAISTCDVFESADDPFFNKALTRWGLPHLTTT